MITDILSVCAIVTSLFAVLFVLKNRIPLQIINVDGQEFNLRWEGKVLGKTLQIETDGKSVIISDKLEPYHNQQVTVIALPKDL